MDWQNRSMELWRLGKSWGEISREIQSKYFPDTPLDVVRDTKVRSWVRRQEEYKNTKRDNHSVISYDDGSIVSERFIKLQSGEMLSPKEILELHGLDPLKWQVQHCINNFWNSQLKGGILQISYQSKLTAKPIKCGIDLAEIDKHFTTLDRKNFTPQIAQTKTGTMMAEINIADLHLGKLCWHGDTPENFDYKIARDLYYRLIGEIAQEIKTKPIEYITFVWANDFFNSDNIEQTTTGGTRQDTDVRWQKLFSVGVEMLVRGIEMLSEVAPVKTFWTPSNHDEVTGYHALKFLEAWFRKSQNVEIDSNASQRKYQLYGNTLIGYAHGCKIQSSATKEKASRLASLMPIEARELWSKALYREMHVGHLHSEQMTQEINGVIVRRISSPTADDAWHTESGFIGAVRKAQTFLYDKERGLMQIINTPV